MNEKMREEFEDWHSKEVVRLVLLANAKAAFSLELNKEALFYVWKASRESLVIELPVIIDGDWANTRAERLAMQDAIRMCKRNIEAKGLKAKP
jgi:hypothetical protein